MSKTVFDVVLPIIKEFESLHDGDLSVIGLQPKLDPIGIWTCGWGHALKTPDGKRFLKLLPDMHEAYRQYRAMTSEQAEELLLKDASQAFKTVLDASPVLKYQSPEKQAAILDFVFNCGINAYSSSTLKLRVDKMEWGKAAVEIMKWNKGNGKVLRGLTRRRQREADLLSL